MNLILATDSYKLSHWKQYPPGTTEIYSYLEARVPHTHTVFFGLQYALDRIRDNPLTQEHIEEAASFCEAHFGRKDVFNREGWQYILDNYHGQLPLEIRAVAEGTPVPSQNVLMTIRNTDPHCFWLTNHMETILLSSVWYGSTVASYSRACKQVILQALDRTGDPNLIPFKLHDFGYRGVSSDESAGLGGAAHLVNFMGTDTIAGILCAQKHYGGGSSPSIMPGFSIPATEHSTITSWGQDCEYDAFRNFLNAFPTGLIACVSDSFDINKACLDGWGNQLRAHVMKRDGVLVVRPDSGHPPEMVLRVLELLGCRFGTILNSKGYKVLDPHVRVIQGDGVNLESITEILKAMTIAGWSADNVAFGMGGALLQSLNRDTYGFAIKCSSATIDNNEKDVFKRPSSDPSKNSKRGKLALVLPGTLPLRTERLNFGNKDLDLLRIRYLNGHIPSRVNFSSIRERAKIELKAEYY